MRKHTVAWKDNERRIARALNGQRLGPTGKSNEDVNAPGFAVECKQRESLPAWLCEPLATVRKHAGGNRIGAVVWHAKGAHDSVVVMSFSDFVKFTAQG